MRPLYAAAILIAVCAAVAVAAGPPVIARPDRKFDHVGHAASAQAEGKTAACADCHAFEATGAVKPGREHLRCAGCHQESLNVKSCDMMKTSGPKSPARLCQVCHRSTTSQCLPGDLPARPAQDSYVAKFAHAKHATLGTGVEKQCALCHTAQAPAPTTKQQAHVLCAGCHNPNGVAPAMTACASCHVARPAAPAPRTPDPFRLAAFDHRAHSIQSKQASCLGCHDKLGGAAEGAMPRPSMLGCQQSCHDGKTAFSATGTSCTACHTASAATASVAPVKMQAATFSHAQHAARGVATKTCASCHATEANGTLHAPLEGKDHYPCATAGCHQTEFASRSPKICGACHDSVAPWQQITVRTVAPTSSDYVSQLNHAAHVKALAPAAAGNQVCASCHGDKLAGAVPPRGHDACAQCHSKGQAPAMSECAACHAPRPAGTASTAALPARTEWSVAATFSHAKHATAPRSQSATPCVQCHSQVAQATNLVGITRPTMQQCGVCHDGTTAFKTTGFGCARCHTREVVGAAP